MKVICDFSKVSEIYKNCSMLDFDVTKSLISLRKRHNISSCRSVGDKKNENSKA